MTKLVSGRVGKIPSANVSADRYQFLTISEAEPDLGLPSQLGQVFTSDLSGNRYWTRLDTANVTENGRLYFTNDRVTANVANLSIDILFDVKLGANLSTGKALVYDSNVNAFVPVFVNSEVANVADIAVRVLSLENQTTANVREASSNLYFTNTRVLDAIAFANVTTKNLNVLGGLTVRDTSTIANLLLQYDASEGVLQFVQGAPNATFRVEAGQGGDAKFGSYSAGRIEFPYNGNAIISAGLDPVEMVNRQFKFNNDGSLVVPRAIVAGNIFVSDITAANIRASDIQAAGNLDVTGRSTLDLVVADDIRSNVATFGYATVGQLTVNSNLTVYGNFTTYGANNAVLSDNMLYLNHGTNTAANPDLGIVWAFNPDGAEPYQHGGIFRDATDGVIKFFQHYTVEPDSNAFLDLDNGTTGFEFANIQATTFIGNVIGVVSSLSNHTTDNLTEGTTRQYFTNVRVLQAVNPLLTTANVSELNNQYFTNVRVLQAVDPKLTTANVLELTNLYFTNARVLSNVEQMSINVLADVDITGVGVGGVLVWDGTKFVPGSTDVTLRANFANTAGVANVALLANVANLVVTLSNFTTNDLTEGANALYYTNSRTRSAFTAGRGIVIQEDGVIKTTIGSDLYSSSIDGVRDYIVTATMDNALVFPSVPTTDRFVLRSLHITNISEELAHISANVAYATGNVAMLATNIPVPVGSVVEFMGDKTQVFAPGDTIRLRGFDKDIAGAANKLSAYMTFETIPNDPTYFGVGETLATSNNDIMIADMTQSAGIFESIKFVNHKNTSIPVRLTVTSANNTPKAYWAYNMQVPAQSSVEVLQAPKLLRTNDRLFARYDNASNTDSISVFTSYRLGSVTNFVSGPGTLVSGNTGTVMFTTSITDGTTLYYTLE